MEATNPFCKYRYMFGKEGEGAHKYRVFNIAIIDTLLTILGAWMIAFYFHFSFWKVLLVVFLIGLLLHRLFCVQTTVTKWVFGSF